MSKPLSEFATGVVGALRDARVLLTVSELRFGEQVHTKFAAGQTVAWEDLRDCWCVALGIRARNALPLPVMFGAWFGFMGGERWPSV